MDEKRCFIRPTHREKARAESRSVRLFLTHLHRDYDIKRPVPDFIRQMRRFPLPVLKEAERAFSGPVHRDDIKDRASYFAAITRRCFEREAEQREREQEQQRKVVIEKAESIQSIQKANPDAWLRVALETLALQWIPERNALLFGGAGLGKRNLAAAIAHLAQIHGPQHACDVATGVFAKFKIDDPKDIGPKGLDVLRGHP